MARKAAIGLGVVGVGVVLATACSGEPAAPPTGSLAEHVERVSAEQGVPADLVLAIAVEEQGLGLPRWRTPHDDDFVPVAGILELRRGRLDTLALGAKLMGTDERALRSDTDLGTEAGIRVLRSLAPAHPSTLAEWTDALAELSGMATETQRRRYVANVYRVLRFGGTFAARDGERVVIAEHPEIPPQLLIVPPVLQPMVSEFPGSEYFPTDCANKCDTTRPDGNAAVDTIVIHDTEGSWNASVATLQYDSGKSVHYLIDFDGSRWGQFVPESYTAWHAGNYCYNKHSVGIEHVGKASDPNGYATAMYAKSVEMVLDIMTRWPSMKVDRQHVIGHYQVPNGNDMPQCSPPCSAGLDACESDTSYGGAGHHTDPGYYWQWCQYMEMLGGTCSCNDAWKLWNCTTDKTEAWRCNDDTLEKQDCTGGCEVKPIGTPDECTVLPTNDASPENDGAAGASDGGSEAGSTGGSAGSTGSGGTPAGGQASHVTKAEDDGGCGCRLPRRADRRGGGLLFWSALGLIAALRRRRS